MVETEFPLIAEKYQVEKQLATGGFGIAYLAQQLTFNRQVVIKVFDAELAKSPEIRSRIRREARACSAIDHPTVVSVYDHGFLPDGRPFLVFEYVQGTTLANTFTSRPLSANELLKIFTDAASALSAAHAAEIIHRDVTPNNIIIVTLDSHATHYAKLIDFGLVRPTGKWGQHTAQLTKLGETVGSPHYMSPEQCKAGSLDGRSDIYSLGCCMYQAMAGRPPITGNNALEIMHNHFSTVPSPPAVSHGDPVSVRLRSIIMRCLEKDPANRYESCDELLDDLRGNGSIVERISIHPPPATIAQKQAQSGISFSTQVVIVLFGFLTFTAACLILSLEHNVSSKAELKKAATSTPPFAWTDASKGTISSPPDCWLVGDQVNLSGITQARLLHIKANDVTEDMGTVAGGGPYAITWKGPQHVRNAKALSFTLFDPAVNHTMGSRDMHCLRSTPDGRSWISTMYRPEVGRGIEHNYCVALLNDGNRGEIFNRLEGFAGRSGANFAFTKKGELVASAIQLRNHNDNFVLLVAKPSGWQELFRCSGIAPRDWDLDDDNNVVFITDDFVFGRFNTTSHKIEKFPLPGNFLPQALSVTRHGDSPGT